MQYQSYLLHVKTGQPLVVHSGEHPLRNRILQQDIMEMLSTILDVLNLIHVHRPIPRFHFPALQYLLVSRLVQRDDDHQQR